MRKLNKWIRLAPVGAFAIAMGACADQTPTEVQLLDQPNAPSHATISAASVTRLIIWSFT